MPRSVLVGGARTPIGKLSGALKTFQATDLGGFAIAAALKQAGISADQVDYVVMGHVLQAGAGQITARKAALNGGIPMRVPAETVNKVCLSGINAIAHADQLIRLGECDVVVAGGMESMTNAPYLLPGARAGYRYGNQTVIDSTAHDGLFCTIEQRGMGDATEEYNASWASPGRAGRVRRPFARAGDHRGQERDVRRRDRERRGAAAQGRSAHRSPIDEGVRADTTAEAWPSCAPPLPRTAPSRPARHRRSPTAAARSW